MARYWLQLVGAVLIVVGIVGFVPNPLVGPDGLVATDSLHNVVHVLTGLVALGLAYGMRDIGLAAILFGALYGAIFVITLVSPSLFGLFTVPVNAIDHVIHIGVAVVSLGLGLMAGSRATATAGL